MRYSLIFEMAVTEAIGAMSDIPHSMFMLACLDISVDPYAQGGVPERKADGGAKRAWAVGPLGFIIYEVDEEAAIVTLASVISMV